MEKFDFLYNDLVDTKTRFVSFVGSEIRYDLAIVMTDRFYGKKLILDMQSSRFAIIGPDDLDEEEKEEPYIGMSAYDVEYNSTWGSPQDKNITETQYGSREQWVYGSGRYLYIEDDEVVAIQK